MSQARTETTNDSAEDLDQALILDTAALSDLALRTFSPANFTKMLTLCKRVTAVIEQLQAEPQPTG